MNEDVKLAVGVLEKRIQERLDHRKRVRRRILEDCQEDVQIDKDIAGCIAGIRGLGRDPEGISTAISAASKQNAVNALVAGRNAVNTAYALLKEDYGIIDEPNDDDFANNLRPEMPKIADIILERLKLNDADGSKSAPIRSHILETYDTDIHEKTVGMTLYRLSQEQPPLVHRIGRVWYYGPPPLPEESEDVALPVTSTTGGPENGNSDGQL